MKEKKDSRISLRCTQGLKEDFERIVLEAGYSSPSEFHTALIKHLAGIRKPFDLRRLKVEK